MNNHNQGSVEMRTDPINDLPHPDTTQEVALSADNLKQTEIARGIK